MCLLIRSNLQIRFQNWAFTTVKSDSCVFSLDGAKLFMKRNGKMLNDYKACREILRVSFIRHGNECHYYPIRLVFRIQSRFCYQADSPNRSRRGDDVVLAHVNLA